MSSYTVHMSIWVCIQCICPHVCSHLDTSLQLCVRRHIHVLAQISTYMFNDGLHIQVFMYTSLCTCTCLCMCHRQLPDMISTHLYTHIYMCMIAYMCNYMFKARNTCTPIYQDSGSLDHHVYNIYIMYVTCCCLCTYTYLYICVHAYFLVHVCLCVCILRLLRLFIPIQVYTSLYIFNPFYIIFIPSIFVSLPLSLCI